MNSKLDLRYLELTSGGLIKNSSSFSKELYEKIEKTCNDYNLFVSEYENKKCSAYSYFCVLDDSDLEILLIDSKIEAKEFYPFDEERFKQRDEDMSLTSYKEHELIGTQVWEQNGIRYSVGVYCCNNGCILDHGYDLSSVVFEEDLPF